jgi:DNA polymerase III subunit epsilon
LSLLETAIEDSVIDSEETNALEALAESFDLSSLVRDRLKERLLSLFAAQAWFDGHLAKEERAELKRLVLQMNLSERTTSKLLNVAESDRYRMLSRDLQSLPEGWSLGDPLQVGMRIAFTGCDWEQRERLEEICVAKGCRLTGSVSGKTDILVSDDSYSGNKAEAAQKNGTRIVHPNDFEAMLQYIQPAS